MTKLPIALPEGAEVLEASGKGGTGNILLLVDRDGVRHVLKLYRMRGPRYREKLRGFANYFLERKRGASARSRRETERISLNIWLRQGFDVVAPLDYPVPDGITDPALWIEYCDAPLLRDVLSDPAQSLDRKRDLVRRLATDTCRRHLRAVELDEPLLVQEHAVMNHVFVHGDRLVCFDLENGFLPGFPVMEAMAQEMSGYLRSMVRSAPGHAASLLEAWIEGYTDGNLLRRVVEHAVLNPVFFRRVKRWHDRRRGPDSKTAVMKRLLNML
jgi:hypothetical protein